MQTDLLQENKKLVPVVLAGGSGTRFWPRSRRSRAKQVLALSGTETMIQQTVQRLRSLSASEGFLVITNELLAETIAEQIPEVPHERILREPCARNTAPACALAALIVERTSPETVLGVFPSDHVVVDGQRFAEVIRAGIGIAAAGPNIVVLGAPPTRPETGYGYIQEGTPADDRFPGCGSGSRSRSGCPVHEQSSCAGPDDPTQTSPMSIRSVERFTEKPNLETAQQFLDSGNYSWNAGIFLWSAKTLADAIREYCPAMIPPLERIAAAFGTEDFDAVFAEEYPKVENISIDYAVLEPRSAKGADSNIFCLPADFGWNDLGSWSALHEHFLQHIGESGDGNVIEAIDSMHLDASGNYIFAPGLTVALLGVKDLVVVQTDDALLVTTRAHSQQVGRVVSELVNTSRNKLL